jgi:glycosyltransferase involved in cell wall biosynthesis
MHVVRVLGKLEPGGAQLALLRLSCELRRRHGVRTRLIVGDATDEGMCLAQGYGVPVIAFRTRSIVDPVRNLQWERSQRFAGWLTDKLADADLVHAHMVGAWWAVGQVIQPGTPFLATEHNQVNWPRRRVRSLRPIAGRIDRFYAMGPAAWQFAVEAGVRADAMRPARSPIAGLNATLRQGLGTPRLTFAGRFCPDKGPDVLIEAIGLLHRPDLSAYLLGDGPLRSRLVDRIDHLGLAGSVFLPGWVEKPWAYIAGSAVHVVPSREEAWSQSAVLGLGLGVPVVGTNVDGLADTLSYYRGITVAPEDPHALKQAIADVLAGRWHLDRLAARRYAHQYTPARIADFYLAEYQAMLTDQVRRRDLIDAPSGKMAGRPTGAETTHRPRRTRPNSRQPRGRPDVAATPAT